MKRLFLAGFLLALAVLGASAQPGTVSTFACNKTAQYDASSTRTIIIANGNPIYICGYVINSTAGITGQLVFGTGTTCQTGTTALTPAYRLSPNVADPSSYFRGMFVPSANDVCFIAGGSSPAQVIVYYSQQTN